MGLIASRFKDASVFGRIGPPNVMLHPSVWGLCPVDLSLQRLEADSPILILVLFVTPIFDSKRRSMMSDGRCGCACTGEQRSLNNEGCCYRVAQGWHKRVGCSPCDRDVVSTSLGAWGALDGCG